MRRMSFDVVSILEQAESVEDKSYQLIEQWKSNRAVLDELIEQYIKEPLQNPPISDQKRYYTGIVF
jgi:cytochrome c-type biogenesis protein CcmH/NrfF